MNSYCVFGLDAMNYASTTFDTEASIQTNGLRVRSAASEEASVIAAVSTGMSLTVDTSAETVDGWVAVEYAGESGYVSAEYVTTELALGEGVTIEEERRSLQESLRNRRLHRQLRFLAQEQYRHQQWQHLWMM